MLPALLLLSELETLELRDLANEASILSAQSDEESIGVAIVSFESGLFGSLARARAREQRAGGMRWSKVTKADNTKCATARPSALQSVA